MFRDGDEMLIDITKGEIINTRIGYIVNFNLFPDFIKNMIEKRGGCLIIQIFVYFISFKELHKVVA